jgi:ribosomal protein S18 acetylase RimI-like enzyme
MTIDDYDSVYNLWISTPGMGLNDIDDTKSGIEKYLKRNPTTCFVAESQNVLMGVIMCGHDGRRGFIYHTTVHPDYRRNGVGRALLQNALQALEVEGISKVALVVFAENEVGNAFWEEAGFSDRTDIIYRNRSICELTRIDT